jgi:AraC-like DNA-binding protein
MSPTRLLRSSPGVPPVYTFQPLPGAPPVSVLRFDRELLGQVPDRNHAHSHDFLVLAYMERSGGSIHIAERRWPVRAGDVFVVAPGEVVRPGQDAHGSTHAGGWAVFFPPEALGSRGGGSFLAWHSHPLLFPFVGGTAGGVQQLRVPAGARRAWSSRMASLDDELRRRREGFREAALAHLTLLLVDVARLAAEAGRDLTAHEDSLLSRVFAVIEEGYGGQLSLSDVARTVGLTPGHLTTVVRRRTGRTVGSWIAERRMAEARALLVQTDLAVGEVARSTGYDDPAYFGRAFRQAHGMTPLGWRRAAGGAW